MNEDTGLKSAADVQEVKPIAPIEAGAELLPALMAVSRGEIHTIGDGPLLGHSRHSTCWCNPTQHPEDERIWIHVAQEG